MPKPPNNARLPSVTSDIPRDLRLFLDRVREVLATGVTAEQVREIVNNPRPNPNDPKPPGPDNPGPVDPPTPPTGLKTTGEPGAIRVEWTQATYRGHQHTEVWSSATDDRGQALAVGMAPGPLYLDMVGPLVERWYWVRFVNANGVAGPFNAENGTYGKSLDSYQLPQPPEDDLDNSDLGRRLDEIVRWLDDPTFGLRGEAARIRGEFNTLLDGALQGILDDLNAIRDELDDILVTERFDPTKGYAVGDLVIWLNPTTGTTFIYQCKQEIPTPTPPATAPLPSDTAYWNQVGDSAAIQAIVDDIAAAGLILQARGLYDGEGNVIGAMAAALLNVRSVLEDGSGNLLSAGALLALTSRVSTAEGKIEALATAMIEAGVLVEQPDGTYVTSTAFLTLIARIEQIASNLLGNSEFMQADKDPDDDWPNEPPDRWTIARSGTAAIVGTNYSVQSSPRSDDGVRALFLVSGAALTSGQSIAVQQASLPVSAAGRYQASAYVGSPLSAVRARVRITFDDAGSTSFASPDTPLTKSGLGPSAGVGTTLDDYNRIAVFAQAPTGAKAATVTLEVTPNSANPAILYATRPFFGVASENQTVPSPWVPGIQANAYRAAAAAALALDLSYRAPDGPWATATAFLQLKGQIDATEDGLVATNNIALGVRSALEDPVTGLAATAAALDNLRTEVQSGPNSLTSLSQRISGVAATIGNNSSNLLEDVAFAKVDATDQTTSPWLRGLSGDWASATFGNDLPGNVVPRIPESVAFIRKLGTRPLSGSAQWTQDIPVAVGQWYQFSVWLQALRCTARLMIQFRSSTANVGTPVSIDLVNTAGNGATLAGYTRKHIAHVAPTGATLARVTILATSATAADPYLFALRPFFGEAVADQAEPSPWQPPIADAFAFQEMYAEVYDNETGLGALGTLIQGVDNKINDPATGLVALSGAFNGLRSGIEVAYENRLIRSDEFETSWGRTNVAVTANTGAVPGFTGNAAESVREATANGQHCLLQGAVPIEAKYTHTISVYAKSAGGRHLMIRAVTQTAAGVVNGTGYWTFSLGGGGFLGSSGDLSDRSGGIVALADGWYRCHAVFKAPTSAEQLQAGLFTANTATNFAAPPSYTGVATAGLELFGAQVNAGSRPDSYRKTTSTALYGPVHDRLRAVSSATTAVDAQVNDPQTGLPATAAAYTTLNAYAGPGGTLATMVSGLQAGIGKGGNHVPNSELKTGANGWTFFGPVTYQFRDAAITDPEWSVGGDPLPVTGSIFYPTATIANGAYAELRTKAFPVIAGRHYEVSVYLGAHRCSGAVAVYWLGPTGANVGANMTPQIAEAQTRGPTGGRAQLSSFKRAFGVFQAPTGAATAIFTVRSTPLSTSQVNSYLFFLKPFMGIASPGQTTPSEYAVGLEPDIFAALKSEGIVWAEPDSSGAIYTMRLRAKDGTGEAQAGFGMAAVKESNRWISDVRFNTNRFALMDPNSNIDGTNAPNWVSGKAYVVGDLVRFWVSGFNNVSGVFRCKLAHTSGANPGSAGLSTAYWDCIARYPFVVVDGVVYLATAVIRDATIGTAKIIDAAITNAKIANLAVDSAKITDLAVTNAKIANATITGGKIANATLTNVNIVSGTINGINIADLTIGTAKLGGGAAMFMVPFYVANSNAAGAQFNFYAGGGGNDNTKIVEVSGMIRFSGVSGLTPNASFTVSVTITLSNAVTLVSAKHVFRSDGNGFIPTTFSPVYGVVSSAQLGGYNVGSRYILVQTSLDYPGGKAPTFDLLGSATMQKN